ncbi:MAG TPA: fructosamine kinase family protein [Solirubrobacteraceae bacterium]|nr:fructosamine kinase family protein [Solirubrobacteraceae bacterium]
MSLSAEILDAIAAGAGAGAAVESAGRVGGGNINEAWRVELAGGREVFVKTRRNPGPGEYATEAAGLRWLGEPGALRVPEVLGVGEDFLALEWIDAGRLDGGGEEELGRGLAGVHRAGAEGFGGPQPLRIGSISLSNEPSDGWGSFYADRRLRPLIGRAGMSGTGASAVERICERIDQLAGPREPVARLHGDLWSGNVLAGRDGRPWLIDPAAYGGHREVDLAMLGLFGGPSRRFFDAYAEVWPLADGWEERAGLWQLFPLLVHAVLFGGGYASSVEQIARGYA